MEGRLLLKNCSVLRSGGFVTRGQGILIEGAQIKRVEPDLKIPALPGDWVVPCGGRLVMPGLVDCHSQLLASLRGRGIATPSEVAAISGHALALGLRGGVTTHIEHLDAPTVVEAALRSQSAIAQRLGARLIQSHASSTRAQLDANAAAIDDSKSELVRGAIGLWASTTLSDEILAHASKLRRELDCGTHLRVSEPNDEDDGLVLRLDSFQLLTPRTVGVLAKVSVSGLQLLGERGTLLVPWLDFERSGSWQQILSSGVELGLCSGGKRTVWASVLAAVAAAKSEALAGQVERSDRIVWQMLFDAPAQLVGAVYGSKFGAVAEGQTADLVLLDAIEAGDTIGWDRLPLAPVAWTIVGGRVVVREGQLLGADFTALATDAAAAIEAIWARV